MKDNKALTRIDIILICILTLIYSVLSFINLGDTAIPQTQPDMTKGSKKEYITYVSLDNDSSLEGFMLFKGLGKCGVTIYKANDDSTGWEEIGKKVFEDIYKWEKIELNCNAQNLCVSIGADSQAEVFEAAFIGEGGKIMRVNANDCMLFDEQNLVPLYPSYKNGTYFDEIYHVRTAYEHIQGISPYEITHPPLGKIIIGIGIRLFGMTPFGWRFFGNIFGIAMVVLMYVFSKRLFKSTRWAFVASLFISLDFMHFTQTRIATIDSFSVFFIMLMYYLMYIYYDNNTQSLPYKKSLKILALCGISFGLGIATKWICVYAGIGLALCFFITLYKRYKDGENPFRVCLWCVLFFVIIPAVIYFVSYLPYYSTDGSNSAFKTFWDNQVYMFTYHGHLNEPHPFGSNWYTWPLIIRPVWYYGSTELAYRSLCSTIVAMGNPVLWWGGSLSMVYLLFKPKKNKCIWFVIIGFASQFVPWIFVSRQVFIYHFFASVPFIIIAFVLVLKAICERFKWGRYVLIAVIAAALILFFMFYPVISGMVTDRAYVLNFLKWFETWDLCF